MTGREREPIDWGPLLWPPLLFCLKLLQAADPFVFVLLIAAFLLLQRALTWLHSWRMHWIVASLIADWHTAAVQKKLKSRGWKPRRQPLPSRLFVLPAVWMVLSAVMLPATAAHFLVPFVAPRPVTWIEATAAIRSLEPPSRWPRLPPDKLASAAMEGERKKVWDKLVNCLSKQAAPGLNEPLDDGSADEPDPELSDPETDE